MSAFTRDALALDAPAAVDEIAAAIRAGVGAVLRKRGAIVGISGGIDSSVVAALCVRALGRERVLGVLMPERESSAETRRLSALVVEHLGIDHVLEDLTPTLEAVGCYSRRDAAIRMTVPAFGPGWKAKLVLPSLVDDDRLRLFSIVVESPDGDQTRKRLDLDAYLGVVAATSFKQRARTMLQYYHADRLGYAVAGTPNLLEYDQGFFVKAGDGAADLEPIAHLYKTQVYVLGRALGLPESICSRPPTTDTYSLEQSQEEFFFSLPYEQLDLCLWARSHGVPAEEAAPVVELSPEQVERVYRDIDNKRAVASTLHATCLTVEHIQERCAE